MQYRHKLGLDQPVVVRYVRWVMGTMHGDLGTSYMSGVPVTTIISDRLGATLILGLSALALSTILRITLGVVFAIRANTIVDRAGRVVLLLLASVPSFWLGIAMIALFSERLRMLPVAGFGIDLHFVMPTLALGLGPTASLMRVTRSQVLMVLGHDYLRTARAKGLRPRVVATRHILRTACIPIASLLGLRLGQIVAGTVVVESVFAWPGIGSVLLTAISGRDVPVIGGIVLMIGLLFVGTNLMVDLSYVVLDPRIRLG